MQTPKWGVVPLLIERILSRNVAIRSHLRRQDEKTPRLGYKLPRFALPRRAPGAARTLGAIPLLEEIDASSLENSPTRAGPVRRLGDAARGVGGGRRARRPGRPGGG